MVPIHKTTKGVIVPFIGVLRGFSDSSDSEVDGRQSLVDRAWIWMEKEAFSSATVISERQGVIETTGKYVIMTPKGIWMDTKSYFIKKAPKVHEGNYYKSLGALYRVKHPNGPLGSYNQDEFDRRFRKYTIARARRRSQDV